MKTPEERGPRPSWAYDSRDRLGLSDAQVAAAIPGPRRGESYDPATIRKAETEERHMSRPLWRKLTVYYTTLARERGMALEPIPQEEAGATLAGDGGIAELVAEMRAQTAAISELVAALREGAEDRESRLRTVEAVVSLLLRQGAEASQEQSAPHETVV